MSKREGYDEAVDIAKALKGDAVARMRVEVLNPWVVLLESELGKISEATPQAEFNRLMEGAISSIASMIVILVGKSGAPLDPELTEDFLKRIKTRTFELSMETLLAKLRSDKRGERNE